MYSPDAPDDLPAGLRPLFTEAMAIADASPASACALLRILVQSMMKSTGRGGRNIVRDVNDFVAVGSDVGVLRALDVVGLTDTESRRSAELSLSNGHSDVQNMIVLVHVLSRAMQ